MKNLILILKSVLLSLLNLILLLVGSILMFVSALMNQLYIPLLASIPIIIIGLITSGFGSIMITLIIIFIGTFILLLLVSMIRILVSISKNISSTFLQLSELIFDAYYRLNDVIESDISLILLCCKLPKPITYIFLSPCYIVIGIYFVIIYINKLLFIPAIISSIGLACYSLYSYKVDFNEPVAIKLIDTLSFFSTHTIWGNLTTAVIILLAIIGLIIKIALDLRFSADYICQVNESSED